MPAQRTSKTICEDRVTPLGVQQRHKQTSNLPGQTITNRQYPSTSPFPFHASQPPDQERLQTPSGLNAGATSDMIIQHGLVNLDDDTLPMSEGDTSSVRETKPHLDKLELLDLDEWNEYETYDEDPPSCIHYSIEWKVLLNNKAMCKDTEHNLVLAPRFYWSLYLRPKLEKFLQRKLPHRRVTCDDTSVVVSVTGRERDLTKRFDELDIDWFLVEKQLLTWSELFRAGKKLRIDISFNYLEVGQQAPAPTKRTGKRGYPSATQQMLAERDLQIDAEEGNFRQPSIWQEVYNLMRCPGPPCHLGPHCWRDPVGKKHYKLMTHQLKGLIRYVEQGGQLRSHDDVPEEIRQQLYAEEQQQLERHRKTTKNSMPSFPPINITNVLPGSSLNQPPAASPRPRLIVPGFWDVAVEEYTDWQVSQVKSEKLQVDIQKARDIALEDGLDLRTIYEDQDPSFFTERGIKIGVAKRFVRDIEQWVTEVKSTVAAAP